MHNDSFSFFDFDNTIYKGQSRYLILDFAIFLTERESFDSAELKNIQSLFSSYYQGSINRHDFGVLVVESYYRGLSGRNEKDIFNQAHDYWNSIEANAWFSYSISLLKLINNTTTPILVSGSPFEILQVINNFLKFKEIYASKGIIQNSIYTGRTEQEMATLSAKAKLMDELSDSLSFNPATSFAFGDSESDFPLLQAVAPDNAYLIGASASMKKQILNNNWNLLDQETEILNHVKLRIKTLNPS